MEVLDILHKLVEQKMLSDNHLEFHGIPIEGAFFNLFSKFESLGFEESPVPKSDNMMFMKKGDNDIALIASIGEPSMLAYEIREMIIVAGGNSKEAKLAKLSELEKEKQVVVVPGEESDCLLVMNNGKYTGIITVEEWEESDAGVSYIAITYYDANSMLEHEKNDFE